MLDIDQTAFELMFPVYRHSDENKDYLSIYILAEPSSQNEIVEAEPYIPSGTTLQL